jgi:hypothetical protein
MKPLLRIICISGVLVVVGCSSGDSAKEDKANVSKDTQVMRDGSQPKVEPSIDKTVVFKPKEERKKIEAEEEIAVYPVLMVQPQFMDHALLLPSAADPATKEEDKNLGKTSLRFGIIMPQEKDPKPNPEENPSGKKRLTYFPEGISNNTCMRIDGNEYLLGSPPKGKWKDPLLAPLGKAADGRTREGARSIFVYPDENIEVTQIVEVVPNDQPTELKLKDGKTQDVRLLDRVLVRYVIENKDAKAHDVGLRFLLDTFIGTNDGVPFTIPGVKDLCNTKREFDPSKGLEIPDYIQALENPDIKNPGTVAHLALRLKGLETPNRVTLGAWPHYSLKTIDAKARGHLTLWDVPFLDMQTGKRNDSAVTMYWDAKQLRAGEKRELGFAYGLGSLAATGGKIGLSVGGSFVVGGTFTVTALVSNPQTEETVTLELPSDFKLVEGSGTQKVPPLPPNAQSQSSPVTWKVTSSKYGKRVIKVTRSTGGSQKKTIAITSKLSFVD